MENGNMHSRIRIGFLLSLQLKKLVINMHYNLN